MTPVMTVRDGAGSCRDPSERATSASTMPALPTAFSGVTVLTKANVYFDGRVVSHTVQFPDGAKKTLGLIYPGSYHFNTGAPERMEIVDGRCRVALDAGGGAQEYGPAQHFDVAGNSGFTIEVASGLCQYICSFR